jgi:glycosyltransferase involved in cell wall biosynthesis
LYEAKRAAHPDVHCFPSSVDKEHFRRARVEAGDDLADQAFIPKPRIGFFGVIDERLDCELLEAVADVRPDWNFVMIGPVVKIPPEILPRRPNIHWLGQKPYSVLPDYLRHWNVGFMPFARNEATRYISPTKTPEFLAAGLRVVSTPIPDVERDYGDAGLVTIADTPDAAVQAIEALLTEPKEAWLARVDLRLERSSWDATWADMRSHMQSRLDKTATALGFRRRAPASS